MSEPIITLEDVSFSYPHATGGRAALDGVSLEIGRGELLALVGANGSGKSTLARLLNGLLLPHQGSVRVMGLDTSERGNLDAIRESVGMVFQNPESQIVANSVEDDIAFGLENIGLPAEAIERRIDRALALFGLEGLREREPHWLSGGQKQRTVLAGVMALEPDVLVLDEPTSMLDPVSQREFRALIDGLWRGGRTIVYITHIMDELAGADRVVVMADGGIIFQGTPAELFGRADIMRQSQLEPPLAARLGRELARRGLDLPPALTLEELVG